MVLRWGSYYQLEALEILEVKVVNECHFLLLINLMKPDFK
jgi:hypothetical protein